MKYLFYLAGLVFSMLFVACSDNDDDTSPSSGNGGDLVGVWKYGGTDVYGNGGSETYMDFMSNGTYIVIDVDEREISIGTWQRSGKKLKVVLPDGQDDDYEEEADYKIEDGKLYITSEKTGVVLTIVAQRVSDEVIDQYLTIQKIDDFLKDKSVVNLNDFLFDYNLCPDKNHPHVIDLGDAGKWACCNVGASSPAEFGGYYAWGETEEKDYYSSTSYMPYDYGLYDDVDDIAGTEWDVAHVKWGGSWKMPSSDRIQSLIENCSLLFSALSVTAEGNFNLETNNTYDIDGKTYIINNADNYGIYNGKVYNIGDYDNYDAGYMYLINDYVFVQKKKFSIYFYGDDFPRHLSDEIGLEKYRSSSSSSSSSTGLLLTGKNGKSIFLPLAGYRWNDHTSRVGSYGYYWSSSRSPYSWNACSLYFSSGNVGWGYNRYPYDGRSVRPVTE